MSKFNLQRVFQKKAPRSRITDLEGKHIQSINMQLNLGDLIEFEGNQYVCIGAGSFADADEFKDAKVVEEKRYDIVRNLFNKFASAEIPIAGKDDVWEGIILKSPKSKVGAIRHYSGTTYISGIFGFNEEKAEGTQVNLKVHSDFMDRFVGDLDLTDDDTALEKRFYVYGHPAYNKKDYLQIFVYALLGISDEISTEKSPVSKSTEEKKSEEVPEDKDIIVGKKTKEYCLTNICPECNQKKNNISGTTACCYECDHKEKKTESSTPKEEVTNKKKPEESEEAIENESEEIVEGDPEEET